MELSLYDKGCIVTFKILKSRFKLYNHKIKMFIDAIHVFPLTLNVAQSDGGSDDGNVTKKCHLKSKIGERKVKTFLGH